MNRSAPSAAGAQRARSSFVVFFATLLTASLPLSAAAAGMRSVVTRPVHTLAAPTASMMLSDTLLSATDTAVVTIMFSEAVTGFTLGDLIASNAVLSGLSSTDGGVTWTVTLTPVAGIEDATNAVTLDNSGVTDSGGISGSGTTQSPNYAIDTLRPTATITLSDTLLQSGETAIVTFAFSEAVTGLTSFAVTAPNGSLGGLSSSDGGVTWLGTFTPAVDVTDASNVITLNLTAVADAAGNSGSGTVDSPNYAVDTPVRPTAAITLSDTALAVGETAVVTVTFSEAVSGFTTADLIADNASLSGLSSMDGGVTWTTTLTPAAFVDDATNVVTLFNSGVSDADGNTGTGTTLSPNYAIDAIPPTATIALSDTLLQNGETAVVTIVFSEPVSGLTATDFTVPNGTLTALASVDGGVTWSGTLTPAVDVTDASNVITLNMTGVADIAGNSGSGTVDSPNYAVDTPVGPSATITLSDTALAAGETAVVTVTFSESVTGFTIGDLTAPHSVLSGISSIDGGVTWTLTLTPLAGIEDATNVVTLDNSSVADSGGTIGTGTTQSPNYAIDTLRPTATITLSDTALAAGETAVVTIAFSEAVTGLTTSDLTVPNGSLTSLASSDGGVTWQATLAPAADVSEASNVITLNLAGVADLAGNNGSGTADSPNYAVDTSVAPTASIALSDTALAVAETSLVTITFSEAVTGFTAADLTVENGSVSGLSSGDGGITWTATLTPAAGIEDPVNVITLDNSGVSDAGGNSGVGTTLSPNYAIDTLRPTATITLSDTALAAGETAVVTITFSEVVTGLTISDLTAESGTLTNPVSADGGVTWTATFTPMSGVNDSSNVIVLDNSKVSDAAGNAGIGSTSSINYAVVAAVTPAAVPTLGTWLQLLLALSLCAVALRVVGR